MPYNFNSLLLSLHTEQLTRVKAVPKRCLYISVSILPEDGYRQQPKHVGVFLLLILTFAVCWL